MAAAETFPIELRCGRASAGVAPEIGGALAWFHWDEDGQVVDWLRPADTNALTQRDAGAMACFPLVPYSNRVRDGRFTFEGRPIQLPVSPADPHFEHGHGWRKAWTITHHTAERAVLRHRHEPDAWPWRYEAEQDITLTVDALTIRLTVHNLSETAMPAGFGLHPYFPASPGTRIEAELQAMWETDPEVLPTRRVALDSRAQSIVVNQADLDNVFTGWSRRVVITWPERDASLALEAEAPLDFLVLYTPRGEPFFCAEPVSNITDAFNLASTSQAATGLIAIAPGEARMATVRFAPQRATAI